MKQGILLVIYLITLFLILKPQKISSKYLFMVWLPVYLILVYCIHSGEPAEGSDLQTYTRMFRSETFEITDIQFLREIMFWALTRLIYSLVQDGNITFLVLDFIFGLVLFNSFLQIEKSGISTRSNFGAYLVFAYLLFFPVLNGYHVIYRQLVSMLLFLSALGFILNNKKIVGFIFLFSAMLFHNVSVLFSPMILISFRKRLFNFAALVGLVVMPFALKISELGDIEEFTRGKVEYLNTLAVTFFIVLSLILVILITLNYRKKNILFFDNIAMAILIYMICFFSLETNLFRERIGLFCFGIIYLFLSDLFEYFPNRTFYRLVFFHLSLLPTLTFYSSYLL